MPHQESCFGVRTSHRGWLYWRGDPRMWRWSQNLERKTKLVLIRLKETLTSTLKWKMFQTAHLLSGVQSGVWRGRPSGRTYMSLSLASRNAGNSGSCRTPRIRTVPRRTQTSQGSLGACCTGLCRKFPPLRRPGQAGRPAESRQTETVEKICLWH